MLWFTETLEGLVFTTLEEALEWKALPWSCQVPKNLWDMQLIEPHGWEERASKPPFIKALQNWTWEGETAPRGEAAAAALLPWLVKHLSCVTCVTLAELWHTNLCWPHLHRARAGSLWQGWALSGFHNLRRWLLSSGAGAGLYSVQQQ